MWCISIVNICQEWRRHLGKVGNWNAFNSLVLRIRKISLIYSPNNIIQYKSQMLCYILLITFHVTGLSNNDFPVINVYRSANLSLSSHTKNISLPALITSNSFPFVSGRKNWWCNIANRSSVKINIIYMQIWRRSHVHHETFINFY